MDEQTHIAITRRVRAECQAEFERVLAAFASRSLAEAGATGVHVLHPPPGSGTREYGILRSFASEADRDAFYETPLYREWLQRIAPMVEGAPIYRRVTGLEAWFREPVAPPLWKMALLTWLGVWPVSMVVPAMVVPVLGSRLPGFLTDGVVAAGITIALTWGVLPLLAKIAHPWLVPKDDRLAP